MDAEIQRIVRRASVLSAGLGFAFAPVPTADGVAMLPVQVGMFIAIARSRGRRLRDVPWGSVARATAAASVVRSVANVSLRVVPRAGRLSNVVTAVALTRFLGWYVDRACADPADPPRVSIRELWRTFTTRQSTVEQPGAERSP